MEIFFGVFWFSRYATRNHWITRTQQDIEKNEKPIIYLAHWCSPCPINLSWVSPALPVYGGLRRRCSTKPIGFKLVVGPILPLSRSRDTCNFFPTIVPCPKFLHSKCALAVGHGLRTKQPTGTRDSVHTVRDVREVCFCRYQRRVPFMTMFFLCQWLLFLWQTFRFVHRINTAQSHNPHAQKFLLSVANHICIGCLCHCSGAHYYRIALYPMHHISMYPWQPTYYLHYSLQPTCADRAFVVFSGPDGLDLLHASLFCSGQFCLWMF